MCKIRKVCLCLVLILLSSSKAYSSEAVLTILYDSEKVSFTRSQLLDHPRLEKISIDYAPVYSGRKIIFSAIKVGRLFDLEKIPQNALIQYRASDGYSAPLEKEYLLNVSDDKSIAYLAIEDPREKWPALKGREMSAGPFYLVWLNPRLSHIPNKAWPYWVESFEIRDVLEAEYPRIMPAEEIAEDHAIRRGLQVYVKHCFACHTINLSGTPKKGPDLNIPMNATEYFQEEALKKLIRRPGEVRTWPGLAMSGFSEEELVDKDLEDLIAYLKHMGGRKIKVEAEPRRQSLAPQNLQ